MSVYDELCSFVLAHRSCGETRAHLATVTDWRYRVRLTCSCGRELKRSVTRADARQDLLYAASSVVESWAPRTARRRLPRDGSAGSAHRSSSAA